MSDPDALDERLRAVERALTESDDDLIDVRDAAELTSDVETIATRLDEVTDRLDELDAATQALRGYVGNVRAVNESVERRADAALAKAEALEADRCERRGDESNGSDPEFGDTDENDPKPMRSDDEVAESDGSLPCRCGSRRRRTESRADECGGTAEPDRGERGLLARIAEAL